MNDFLDKNNILNSGLSESEFLGLKKYKEIEYILKKFPPKGKFFIEKELTKKESKDILDNFIKMSEKDWDLLTILRLFDKETFEHSINSFVILKNKIESLSAEAKKYKKELESELGDLGVIYRACLFHDIGKIKIPKFILKNSLSDREWALRFYRIIKKQKNKICFTTKKYFKKNNIFKFIDKIAYAKSPDEILRIFQTKNIRPVQVVSLKYGINKKELKRLRKEYGIEGDISLADLMSLHEKESYTILNKLGYKKEALIAGSHGEQRNTNGFKTNLSPTMNDINNLIYLADVQEALGSERYYHKALPLSEILLIFISKVDEGLIDEPLLRFWIEDEKNKNGILNGNQKTLDKIDNFLFTKKQ